MCQPDLIHVKAAMHDKMTERGLSQQKVPSRHSRRLRFLGSSTKKPMPRMRSKALASARKIARSSSQVPEGFSAIAV